MVIQAQISICNVLSIFFQNIFFPKQKICGVSHERNRGNPFLKKISFQAEW